MLQFPQASIFVANEQLYASSGPDHRKDAIKSRRLRILVIDDDDDLRDSMALLLASKYGAIVASAESGLKGIEALKAGSTFDVIFLDLRMSEMDGLQTFHELRRQGVTSRIVLMSAHGRGPEWNEALKLNVELFEKPILEETLVSILSEL